MGDDGPFLVPCGCIIPFAVIRSGGILRAHSKSIFATIFGQSHVFLCGGF
jgi:hypothetical protein